MGRYGPWFEKFIYGSIFFTAERYMQGKNVSSQSKLARIHNHCYIIVVVLSENWLASL